MCYKGQFPKIGMRNKGFKMKLRTLMGGNELFGEVTGDGLLDN